jgi:hypothetical protein
VRNVSRYRDNYDRHCNRNDGNVLSYKNKLKKDLWVFCLLLIFATGVNIALSVKIPNPLDFLTIVYKPVYDLIFSLFE